MKRKNAMLKWITIVFMTAFLSVPGAFAGDEEPYSDDEYYEEDTSSETVSTEKTLYQFWQEAFDRLTTHPDKKSRKNGYKIDPNITGEWMCYSPGPAGSYSVYLNYYRFDKNGSGVFQQIPIVLLTDLTLQVQVNKAPVYEFAWGVGVEYSEEKPVPILTMQFKSDKSLLDALYAWFDGTALGLLFVKEGGEIYSKAVYYPRSAVDEQWDNGDGEALRKLLADAYQKKVQEQVSLSDFMTSSMVNNYIFQNTLNSMSFSPVSW